MQTYLIDILQCPACGGGLAWKIEARQGERIEQAEARCQTCTAQYAVQDGIGIFLIPDPGRQDPWEVAAGGLESQLRENPELEQRLMGAPVDRLSPADRFFRAQVLEERGEAAQAHLLHETAKADLYTPEYLICHESQVHYVVDHLAGADEAVIDLATGRGSLATELAHHLDRPLVASDLSPRSLRRTRRQLERQGLADKASFLAFDARRTPFKKGGVPALTTDLGLANIQDPGDLLAELRRVAGGPFLAVHTFYDRLDEPNAAAIEKLGLSAFLYQDTALEHFWQSGWRAEARNMCQGRAEPTPESMLFAGARVDALPAAATQLTWTTLWAEDGEGVTPA